MTLVILVHTVTQFPPVAEESLFIIPYGAVTVPYLPSRQRMGEGEK